MKKGLSKFDLMYESIMFDSIVCEDMLDIAEKAIAVDNSIKKYVGIALQCVNPNPAYVMGMYMIGKTGKSKKLFGVIGKHIMKNTSMFQGATAGGTTTGSASAVAGAPAAGVGAAVTGTAGGVAGAGIGGAVGFACRNIVGKLGELFFSFLGECNDYVSKEKLNPMVNKIKDKFSFGSKDKDVNEWIEYANAYDEGIIMEGVIDKLTGIWDKLVEFYTKFLSPMIKTMFNMLVISLKKYKEYVKLSSDEEYSEIMLKNYDEAAKKSNLKDEGNFKPKTILDYFFGIGEVQSTLAALLKKAVETIVKLAEKVGLAKKSEKASN